MSRSAHRPRPDDRSSWPRRRLARIGAVTALPVTVGAVAVALADELDEVSLSVVLLALTVAGFGLHDLVREIRRARHRP